MLKRVCAENPQDWDRYLSAVLFAYMEVPSEGTGLSPFDLVYGRKVRSPIQILRELWTKETPDKEIKTSYRYVVDLRQRLETVGKIAQENFGRSQRRQKTVL